MAPGQPPGRWRSDPQATAATMRNVNRHTSVFSAVAQAALRIAANVAGDFFVDSTCIDCDACRQIAPTVFHDVGDQSAVFHQPESSEELLAAQKALVACPTASIGDVRKRNVSPAIASYPELIEDDVYRCGFTSESSFGAFSYLIRREPGEGNGNVLVDSSTSVLAARAFCTATTSAPGPPPSSVSQPASPPLRSTTTCS